MLSHFNYRFFLSLLIIDLAVSFYQHYHMPLDGDMSGIIYPNREDGGFYKVLENPTGINTILKNETYANPNRFFAHYSASKYFTTIPFLFQKFVSPIDSIFLSSALVKIVIHMIILFSISVFSLNKLKNWKLNILITATLVAPMFQISGYNRYMGVIDQSIIYTFFYAIPVGLLMLFFIPYYLNLFSIKNNLKINILKFFLITLIPLLSLNGPLIPGIVLIACPLIIGKLILNNFNDFKSFSLKTKILEAICRIDKFTIISLSFFCVFCIYSMYVGRYNILTIADDIPLIDRYKRLPSGLYYLFTQKLGFILLLSTLLINLILIKKYFLKAENKILLKNINWLFLFIIFYIILLPLGGFRPYRENIIRYDTIIPVTITLIIVYGKTTFFILTQLNNRIKNMYLFYIIILSLIFTNADKINTESYECQKQALEKLSTSNENIVPLTGDCPLMTWGKIYDCNLSKHNSKLLRFWKIIEEEKLYYQVKNLSVE